ncbi:toll/interleukin-1 receptor domain-containing protein [Erythrobacter oryzae]|uniref:toll/interleukin-1 receptor domain-containing protein n=1 Tax=Erythrobacter oryzae TaxID=3019556 RepID=UPI002555F21A|nr:TIR domain-containing protein [Erythrobacter sp. COR-2]
MGGIFLSYSRADRDHAHAVVQGLRALGVEVWWDEDMPGVDWQFELTYRITEMAAVMVLWSPKSLDSKNVGDEARLAYKQDKLINALIGVPEPREPFARINGLPLDGWDGREPHNGWRRLVQTAESFLVKAGDVPPGAVVAALDRVEAEWAALKLEHRTATEAFSEAQVALYDTLEAEQEAKAAAAIANNELKRIAQLDLDPKVLAAAIAAAQQLVDERAAALAEATSAAQSARAKLSHASRKMKRLEDALKRPEAVIPAGPITPAPPLEANEPGPEPVPKASSGPQPETPETDEPTLGPGSEPIAAAPTNTPEDDAPPPAKADDRALSPAGSDEGAATPIPERQTSKPIVAMVIGGMIATMLVVVAIASLMKPSPAKEVSPFETVAAETGAAPQPVQTNSPAPALQLVGTWTHAGVPCAEATEENGRQQFQWDEAEGWRLNGTPVDGSLTPNAEGWFEIDRVFWRIDGAQLLLSVSGGNDASPITLNRCGV